MDEHVAENSRADTSPEAAVSRADYPEARLRAILAAALDPIVTIDAHGVIHSASDSVLRVFGWTPEELVGRNVSVLMPEPYHSAHDGYLAKYRQTGETAILGNTREYAGVRRNGEVFPLELSVSRADPVPGEPIFIGILRDVSDRKRIERQLQQHQRQLEELVTERTQALRQSQQQLRVSDRFATIGTLAAGLGHDMSNVLLPVFCRLDAMESVDLPDSAREGVGAVRESMEYLRQITNALRLLTLDPSQQGDEDATVVADWWSQVGSLLARAAPRTVRVWLEADDDLPPVAMAPHQLTQAMLNLIVNAGEAIEGAGLIKIEAGRRDDDVVDVVVSDTGRGMDAQTLHRACDPFFTTKTRGVSTGLGLAIVHGVVRGAGGTLRIESEPGKGTIICMTLPIADSPIGGASAQTAAVDVHDGRVAAFLNALLVSLGVEVAQSGAGGLPAADLWVLEGDDEDAFTNARRFLRVKQGRAIVAQLDEDGAKADRWREIGASVCVRSAGVKSLRLAVLRAAKGTAKENIS